MKSKGIKSVFGARRLALVVLFSLIALGMRTNRTGAQTIFPGSLTTISGNTDAAATGDLNGDGKQDVVIASDFYYYGQISVLFGSNNGTFGTPVNYPIYTVGLSSITLIDINGDGKLDIVAGNYGVPGRNYYPYNVSDCISVLINNGDGTFKAPACYYVGPNPTLVDINGDGRPDIIGPDGNRVAVLLNNGDGIFGAKTDYATGNSPTVTMVDVNGDGKPDLCTANGDSTVSVLLNNGDGTFAAKTDYPVYVAPDSPRLLMQDINGDGKPDMLSLISVYNGGYVSVRLNNGDGTFGAKTDYSVGPEPNYFTLADINGDGKIDLITQNFGAYDSSYNIISPSSVSVLTGNGNGTFNAEVRVRLSAYVNSSHPIVTDVDGDGKADIVTYDSSGENMLTVFYGGSNVLLTRVDYPTPEGPQSIQVLDIDGDGRPDIVTGGNSTISIFQNKGARNFAAHRDYITDISGSSFLFADVTGDGKPDLILPNDLAVYPNNGDGTFHGPPAYPLSRYLESGYLNGVFYGNSLMSADMNGDGKIDVIANCYIYLAILHGNGDGTFQPEVDYAGAGANAGIDAFAVSDIDGDGKLDFVIATSDNTLRVSLNNGLGGFITGGIYALTGSPNAVRGYRKSLFLIFG